MKILSKLLSKYSYPQIFEKLEDRLVDRYFIDSGGFIFKICLYDKIASDYVNSAYSEFKTINDNYDFIVNVHSNKLGARAIRENSKLDKNYLYGHKQFKDYFYYRLNKNKPEIDLILPETYELEAFDNFFRLIFSSRSLSKGMILIHASAIIKNNEIILFIGPSGEGKSTIAALSEQQVVHDDLLALSISGDDKVMLQTIPFKPDFKQKVIEGKLSVIYRIYQHKKTYVDSIEPNDQLGALLHSIWSLDEFTNDSSINQEYIDFCCQLLSLTTVKKLHFNKSKEFLKII